MLTILRADRTEYINILPDQLELLSKVVYSEKREGGVS
jgi:hypothetical protein